jgi:hypothetical protein
VGAQTQLAATSEVRCRAPNITLSQPIPYPLPNINGTIDQANDGWSDQGSYNGWDGQEYPDAIFATLKMHRAFKSSNPVDGIARVGYSRLDKKLCVAAYLNTSAEDNGPNCSVEADSGWVKYGKAPAYANDDTLSRTDAESFEDVIYGGRIIGTFLLVSFIL